MSDFEILSLVLAILTLVVMILLHYIEIEQIPCSISADTITSQQSCSVMVIRRIDFRASTNLCDSLSAQKNNRPPPRLRLFLTQNLGQTVYRQHLYIIILTESKINVKFSCSFVPLQNKYGKKLYKY